jgi:tripartite-type tricarboxylate transporter receptor subunit TctC
MTKHARFAFIVSSVLLFLSGVVTAQTYPSKSIKLIVDGPPGGINDIWARRYSQRMSETMAVSIVVENRTGASGTIAAEALTKSPADGYTLMYGGMTPLVTLSQWHWVP